MEEFLQQKSISFERAEMNWYAKANEDGHVEDDGQPDEEDDGPVVPPPAPVAQRKHKGKGKGKGKHRHKSEGHGQVGRITHSRRRAKRGCGY